MKLREFMQKIAFFDRDGTLNLEKNYLYLWEDFEWLPEVKDMLKWLKNNNYLIAVVTNQSGIARKYYSEKDVKKLHEKVNEDLFETHSINIDYFEHCPHHPEFSEPCECRKPGTKMLETILNKVKNVDIENSFIVGDKLIDLEAGKRLGIKGYLSSYGYGETYKNEVDSKSYITSYMEFVETL